MGGVRGFHGTEKVEKLARMEKAAPSHKNHQQVSKSDH